MLGGGALKVLKLTVSGRLEGVGRVVEIGGGFIVRSSVVAIGGFENEGLGGAFWEGMGLERLLTRPMPRGSGLGDLSML